MTVCVRKLLFEYAVHAAVTRCPEAEVAIAGPVAGTSFCDSTCWVIQLLPQSCVQVFAILV